VDDCACIAIPDPGRVLGEVVKAYIVTTQSDRVVKEEINRAIAPQIEDYKLPVEYEVTDAIPKTSSGKVQRLLLKK
jgi:acyl-coenzyme A synthetase/AMP-(fatty) acid ligase